MGDGDLGWSASLKVELSLGRSGWQTVTTSAMSAGWAIGVQEVGAEETSPVAAEKEVLKVEKSVHTVNNYG
jgi:hypothetical protein